MRWLLAIDRRIIYVAVLAALTVPFFKPFKLPIQSSKPTDGVYNAINDLPAGAPVLVSMDYDPASQAELDPMAKAALRHMLRRDLRVTGMTHWPRGRDWVRGVLEGVAMEFDDAKIEVAKSFDKEPEARSFIRQAKEEQQKLGEWQEAVQENVDISKRQKKSPDEMLAALDKVKKEVEEGGDSACGRLLSFGDDTSADDLKALDEVLASIRSAAKGGTKVEEAVEQAFEKARKVLPSTAIGPVVDVNVGRARAQAPLKYDTTTPEARDVAAKLHDIIGSQEPGIASEPYEQDGKFHVLRVRERTPTKVYGKDYCYLGVRAGGSILIMNIGQSLFEAFPSDVRANPTRQLAAPGGVLEGVAKLGDFKYLLCIAAGSSAEWWIVYGAERYGVKMGVGCTAVIAPDLYPFWPKQITGIVGGAKGAWEYETKIGLPAQATKRVPAQTVAHILVILLVVFCNVAYFVVGRKSAERR